MLLLVLNLIPLIAVIHQMMKGWRMGVVWEILNLLRFFVSYYLALVISRLILTFISGQGYLSGMTEKVTGSAVNYLSNAFSQTLTPEMITAPLSPVVQTGLSALISIIVYFILAFLISKLFGLIMRMSRGVNAVPIVGFVNRFFGAMFGIAFAILLWSFLYSALQWAAVFFGWQDLALALSQSFWTNLYAMIHL